MNTTHPPIVRQFLKWTQEHNRIPMPHVRYNFGEEEPPISLEYSQLVMPDEYEEWFDYCVKHGLIAGERNNFRIMGPGSLWEQVYAELSTDRPGLAGAVTARGPTMVLRTALIYCLSDLR